MAERKNRSVYNVIRDPKRLSSSEVVFPSEAPDNYYGYPNFVIPINDEDPKFDDTYSFPCIIRGQNSEVPLRLVREGGYFEVDTDVTEEKLEFYVFRSTEFRYRGERANELVGIRLGILMPQGLTVGVMEQLALKDRFFLIGKTDKFP